MTDISLHIYDIAQNAIDAGADHIFISILEKRFVMADNGCGIDTSIQDQVGTKGFTTRKNGRGGSGVFSLRQNTDSLEIVSTKGVGTLIDARFPDDFPDGEIFLTLRLLVTGYPEIAWIFTICEQNAQFTFDTRAERRGLHEGGNTQ